MKKKALLHRFKTRALFLFGSVFILFGIYLLMLPGKIQMQQQMNRPVFWQFQAVDTMKSSRDLSREKLQDPTFNLEIHRQVKNIAATGATHVAIATPYDEEFVPILTRWVTAARENNLKVWFRGNFSGWEGWFDYKEISRDEHMRSTENFILSNQDLFEDGDIFSACPECENGGPGDPRMNGDVAGHKKFLIDEYMITKAAFAEIDKDVDSNYHSMNGDVAKLIMDRDTTQALDGIVVIDHYVTYHEQMVHDIQSLASQSQGKIVLGEFGAPIPDINGTMSEEEQAKWLDELLTDLITTPEIVGMSYWTYTGGSTAIWEGNGQPRQAVKTLTNYFKPETSTFTVVNPLNEKIKDAKISIGHRVYATNNQGQVQIPTKLLPAKNVHISADGYLPVSGTLDGNGTVITLNKKHEDMSYKIRKFFIFTLNLQK